MLAENGANGTDISNVVAAIASAQGKGTDQDAMRSAYAVLNSQQAQMTQPARSFPGGTLDTPNSSSFGLSSNGLSCEPLELAKLASFRSGRSSSLCSASDVGAQQTAAASPTASPMPSPCQSFRSAMSFPNARKSPGANPPMKLTQLLSPVSTTSRNGSGSSLSDFMAQAPAGMVGIAPLGGGPARIVSPPQQQSLPLPVVLPPPTQTLMNAPPQFTRQNTAPPSAMQMALPSEGKPAAAPSLQVGGNALRHSVSATGSLSPTPTSPATAQPITLNRSATTPALLRTRDAQSTSRAVLSGTLASCTETDSDNEDFAEVRDVPSHVISNWLISREQARKVQNFQRADKIRERLRRLGIAWDEDLKTWRTPDGRCGAWGSEGQEPSNTPAPSAPLASYPALKLKGLPYRVKYQDLKAFFQSADLDIVEYSVVLEKNTDGRPSGIGYVKVHNEAAQRAAVQCLNKKTIPGYERYVWVLPTSEAEYHVASTTWAGAVISTPLPPAEGDSQQISRMLKQREECRKLKMYQMADDLRRVLREHNISFDDELRTWTDDGNGSGRWGPSTRYDVHAPPVLLSKPVPPTIQIAPADFDFADVESTGDAEGSPFSYAKDSPHRLKSPWGPHGGLSPSAFEREDMDICRAASSPAGKVPFTPTETEGESSFCDDSAFEVPMLTHIQSLLSAVASKTDVGSGFDITSEEGDIIDVKEVDFSV